MNHSPEICLESDRRVIQNTAGKYGKLRKIQATGQNGVSIFYVAAAT